MSNTHTRQKVHYSSQLSTRCLTKAQQGPKKWVMLAEKTFLMTIHFRDPAKGYLAANNVTALWQNLLAADKKPFKACNAALVLRRCSSWAVGRNLVWLPFQCLNTVSCKFIERQSKFFCFFFAHHWLLYSLKSVFLLTFIYTLSYFAHISPKLDGAHSNAVIITCSRLRV